MQNFLKYNTPSIFWAAFILVICLMPGHDLPKVDIVNFDKFVHIGVYVVLALLTYYGWMRQQTFAHLHQHTFLKILIILSSYGFAVEIMQEICTADRYFDIYDAVANDIGAVIGLALAYRFFRHHQWNDNTEADSEY